MKRIEFNDVLSRYVTVYEMNVINNAIETYELNHDISHNQVNNLNAFRINFKERCEKLVPATVLGNENISWKNFDIKFTKFIGMLDKGCLKEKHIDELEMAFEEIANHMK